MEKRNNNISDDMFKKYWNIIPTIKEIINFIAGNSFTNKAPEWRPLCVIG